MAGGLTYRDTAVPAEAGKTMRPSLNYTESAPDPLSTFRPLRQIVRKAEKARLRRHRLRRLLLKGREREKCEARPRSGAIF